MEKWDNDFLIAVAGKLLICRDTAQDKLDEIQKILIKRGVFSKH